ncbi:hypothetical protein EJ08DRAFT_333713 [Tothia fuscella]|uniref:Secreted protein n=1 Tax=Tothia fuscella TaxID=1048955 RepID=A0A9P4P0Q3_9PEZI|nr:hypothetical protein EJ08DRAFT_333713 [Tothia fuscella]
MFCPNRSFLALLLFQSAVIWASPTPLHKHPILVSRFRLRPHALYTSTSGVPSGSVARTTSFTYVAVASDFVRNFPERYISSRLRPL